MSNLQHHGIKGQKWGVRRFQNTDGSLTAEGKKRYSVSDYQQAIDKTKNLPSKKPYFTPLSAVLEFLLLEFDDILTTLDMFFDDLRCFKSVIILCKKTAQSRINTGVIRCSLIR